MYLARIKERIGTKPVMRETGIKVERGVMIVYLQGFTQLRPPCLFFDPRGLLSFPCLLLAREKMTRYFNSFFFSSSHFYNLVLVLEQSQYE